MVMLTFETFLLLLLAGLLGLAVGHLLGSGRDVGPWSDDKPWLRDARAAPAAPTLPAAPLLLSKEERDRLAAALTEAKRAAAAPKPAPAAPATAMAPPPAAPVAPPPPVAVTPVVEPVPAPPAAAPAGDFALPAEIAAAAVAPTIAPEDAARAADADAVGTRPLALATPLGGKADDLKRIKGIGPQNERKLHGLGVYHFAQFAAWSAENAKWAGSFMAFPGRIEREDWIAQAKVLATGAETAFSKRVDAGDVPTSKSDGKG